MDNRCGSLGAVGSWFDYQFYDGWLYPCFIGHCRHCDTAQNNRWKKNRMITKAKGGNTKEALKKTAEKAKKGAKKNY